MIGRVCEALNGFPLEDRTLVVMRLSDRPPGAPEELLATLNRPRPAAASTSSSFGSFGPGATSTASNTFSSFGSAVSANPLGQPSQNATGSSFGSFGSTSVSSFGQPSQSSTGGFVPPATFGSSMSQSSAPSFSTQTFNFSFPQTSSDATGAVVKSTSDLDRVSCSPSSSY